MAFWGIEVKPGKPITHSCEKARGRLRISQATLGIGEATKKTIVQCNVGKRAPVLLCALIPNQTESCHLDLEFEEADDVIFSVVGPRSVYLTGYYVRQSLQLNPHSDTESYGVDIENTQTEGSSYGSDEDNYDDSFINDDDELHVSPQSPVLSDKGIDEVTSENDKPKGKIGLGKQRKKRFQVIESDNEDDHLPESEDNDAYTLSAFKSKRAVKRAPSDAEKVADVTAEVDNESNDEGVCDESKQKLGSTETNAEAKVSEAAAELGGEAKDEDNEARKKVDPLDINEKLGSAKPKKKRKEHSIREEKTCGLQTDDCNALIEDKEREVEASMDMETDANCAVMLLELGSESDHKVKRRKTELPPEEPQTDEIDNRHYAIPKDDDPNRNTKDLLAADGEYQEKHMVGDSTEGIHTKCDSILEKEEVNLGLQHGDCMTTNPPVYSEGFQEQHIDNVNTELVANDSRPGKKSKKKKKKGQGKRELKKGQGKRELNTDLPEITIAEEATPGDENTNTVPIQSRTLSSGLIIEELANGPPDAKVAAPGKKVKIFYTGMLKENGIVFDSNVGKNPFKFRLGDEAYIDGWNVGIDGMRVGDKRRLIIPPSMGFGDHAMGELVPPNSWVVYEVELVSIRK